MSLLISLSTQLIHDKYYHDQEIKREKGDMKLPLQRITTYYWLEILSFQSAVIRIFYIFSTTANTSENKTP